MKTTEEYLNDYFDKQNELSKKGERWRLRVTPEEFLAEIVKIRVFEIEKRKYNTLNEYHIQRSIQGMISIMLMNRVTLEEARDQFERLSKSSDEEFAQETPEIQKRLSLIQTPLKFRDIVNIYKWLWRKQITMEMISPDVLNEFIKTRHYEKIIRRDEEESI